MQICGLSCLRFDNAQQWRPHNKSKQNMRNIRCELRIMSSPTLSVMEIQHYLLSVWLCWYTTSKMSQKSSTDDDSTWVCWFQYNFCKHSEKLDLETWSKYSYHICRLYFVWHIIAVLCLMGHNAFLHILWVKRKALWLIWICLFPEKYVDATRDKPTCNSSAEIKCICQTLVMNIDISFHATSNSVCVNALLVCWTRSHRAHLGSYNPNYANYIFFWIAQQDFRVSRLSFSPSLFHWRWSSGTDVRDRRVAMAMGATVAFQEDGSWQNEAEHQHRLRMRQVKELRSRWEGVRVSRRGPKKQQKLYLGFRFDDDCFTEICLMALCCKEVHCISRQLVIS